VSGTDYCFHRPANYIWKMGNNGLPAERFPLGKCEGDCDRDSECAEGLKCFSRSAHEEVPGCVGLGKFGNDICFDHTLSEQPTDSPSRTPTTQPTNSPSKTPSATPTDSPTTAMPTDAPTMNVVNSIFDQESYVAAFGCNSPDSRILPRAIDGSTEKYWCDRTGLQAEDTGIIVIPSHNKFSLAQAIRVYASNECTNCDPVTYSLEGRSESNDTWTEISNGNLPWIDAAPGRNNQGQDVSSTYESADLNLAFAEVTLLSNTMEFLQYKLTFPLTRDPSSNSLQFAEVEVSGVLFEQSGLLIRTPSSTEATPTPSSAYSQAISCPPIGSSKVTASGFKIVAPAETDTFCGLFIQKGSGALIPYARSYNSHDWEASPGPRASPANGIACTGNCDFTLPDLQDVGDNYVILAKNGTQDDHRKDIARFLEIATFGPKMSEINALDDGNWDDTDRAQYVRQQMEMDMTSHREYFRKRTNVRWDTTLQEARSNHPCSPNSKWRTYSFTQQDHLHTIDGIENVLTFETVLKEADLTTKIYEADDAGDVSAHGVGFGGLFQDSSSSSRYGYSGTGFYDFGALGDFIEWNINIPEDQDGTYPVSFRYNLSSKSYNGNRPCQLLINDVLVEAVYDFIWTDGWSYWKYTDLVHVSLNAGPNKIKLLVADQDGGPDIDHLRIGKPPAIVMKLNGLPRTVAKNGIRLLDDWSYEITDDLVVTFEDYPYPSLGDLYYYPYGRAKAILPDGRDKYLDTGNPVVDFTGYEEYLPENYFIFDASDVLDSTASDLFKVPMRRDQEFLLRNGLDDPICDLVPSFAEENDAPIFGQLPDGSWLQWTPTIQLEDNGPSINTAPEDRASNVLSDGGGEWSTKTGEKLKCSNVVRSFVNEDTCFLSTENTTCSSSEAVGEVNGGVIVCGSLGEVANDPARPETFGIETEAHSPIPSDVIENQKSSVWTEIALYEPDQLRQRMAWALAQIVTTVPSNIDARDQTEVHLNFYDIFVRHAFGNYRDILNEASYSPSMAEHLTYEKSKSHSYVFREEDKRVSSADENYAREIMQLFSLGLIVLNDDGTPVLDPATGDPLETYTNDDIESFARAWTGFTRVAVRGNYEDTGTGSSSNRLDPLKINPKWRDPIPKSNLNGGFIGDRYPLCADLSSSRSFLKKGATYRLLGGSPSPELMKDPIEFANDAAYNISRVELSSTSALYQRLYNGGNHELTIELENDLTCTTGTIECDIDTLRVVKVGSIYYEFVESPCVQMAFYDNGKQIQLRDSYRQGQMCANPDLTNAREACCRPDRISEVRMAVMETGVTHFYDGERMTYATAKDRCIDYGKDLCLYERVSVTPSDESWRKGYHWTNVDCGINVKVNSEGHVAIVHDATSTYIDSIPYHIEEENTLNWFRVFWNGDGSYPGSSDSNTCAANNCKHMDDGNCLCKTTVTKSVVFTGELNAISKEDVMSQLSIGTIGPPEGSTVTDAGDGLTVHTIGDSVDGNTVFEVQDKGRTFYLKNELSTVGLEGWTMPPQIQEAEDATMSNVITKSSSSATFVELIGNSSSYVEWNVEVPSTGKYLISFRYSLDTSPEPLSIVVNGDSVTRQPVNPFVPTSSTLPPTLLNPRPLNKVGNGGSPEELFPLDECLGDCDNDSECQDHLLCFSRDGTEAIPGCEGQGVSGTDYCFHRPANYIWKMGNNGSPAEHFPLQKCEGDCDSDDECAHGLFCMQNDALEPVPGCSGTQRNNDDYCADMKDFTHPLFLPTGGWDNDWHYSVPLEVNLTGGSNTIRAQIPMGFIRGPNIDNMKIEGGSAFSTSSFRNPPHFMSLISDYSTGGYEGEQTLRDAQYETDAVLDHYFYQDNVASFLCTRIMQRFSFSNPSPRFVASCVEAFRSGSYTSGSVSFGSDEYGSLEAMAAAILLDREATDFAAASDPSHGSMKEPMLKLTHLLRSMKYETSIPDNLDGPPIQTTYHVKLWDIAEKIGHGPFDFPSVFSFFLPEYVPDSGPTLPASLVSPESMLVTMPNVVSIINGMFSLIKYGLSDCNGGLSKSPGYGGCNDDGQYLRSFGHLFYEPASVSLAGQAEELALLLTAGRLSNDNLNRIVQACSPLTDQSSQVRCVQQLILSTGEFHTTNALTQSGEDRVKESTGGNTSTEPYKAIVYYYLSGGLDSYNMLAPHTCDGDVNDTVYDRYRIIRGKTAISEGLGLPLSRMREIQADSTSQPCSSFGIHEDLLVLKQLYDQKQLNFIANAGLLPKPLNVSNYREGTAGVWLYAHNGMRLETEREDVHDEFAGTGVGGRIADVMSQAGIPTSTFSINGQQVVLNGVVGQGSSQFICSRDGLSAFNEEPSIDNMDSVIKALNNATTADSGFFAETWSSKLTEIFDKQDVLKAELDKTAVTTTFPESSTGDEFKMVTQIMQTAEARGSKRDIFYVDTGGFDTHSDADARLIERFTDMNAVFGAFVDELKALSLWESTVVVQFSEFGRTLDPNTNFGADHAWGGHHFMFGGAVAGGKVLGKYPNSFEEGDPDGIALRRGRMIPTTPWDAMWFGVAEWFGVPATGPEMDKVLPMHKSFPSDKLYGKDDLFDVLDSNGEESIS